jgi:hypothetical protein
MMTVEAKAAAQSQVLVTANPDIHTLNIGITPSVAGGDKPFKSRTFDSVTFDFDTAGVLRNIEVQVAQRTTMKASIKLPAAEAGYYVVVIAGDQWPQWDERLFYDHEQKIACIAFSGEILPAPIYRLSDALSIGITEHGVLSSVWVFDVDLSVFL